MASPIVTKGTSGGSVSTDHIPGESIRAWISRHNQEVDDSTPSGDDLTTIWVSAGGDEEVKTHRKSSESDSDFKNRHEIDYMLQMVQSPPAG